MEVRFNLKDYVKDEQKSFYNRLYYKHKVNNTQIKLVFEDDQHWLDVFYLCGMGWNHLFSYEYYDDFELENDIVGIVGDFIY